MLRITFMLVFLDACMKCHSHPSTQVVFSRRSIMKESPVPPSTTTSAAATTPLPASTTIKYNYLGRRDPEIGAKPVASLGALAAPALQWHAGVYSTADTPYTQICGGSIVKRDTVISAAHCFWSDDIGVLHAALFAVAAGKLLRAWDAVEDAYAQRSDVKSIHIPVRFRGGATSFQSDVAVLRLRTPLEYAPGVQPVCVGFDSSLDQLLLQWGNIGTITGWGLTEQNGEPANRLNFLKLPYIKIEECFTRVETSFLKYLTSDKICAGYWDTGKALCRGDSGGGLVYDFKVDNSTTVPYLLGVASTAQRDDNECNANTPASFTHLSFHEEFLKQHVPGLEAECGEVYGGRLRDQGRRQRAGGTACSAAPSVTPAPAAPAPAQRGSLPEVAVPGIQWHAAIYNKSAAYTRVCGGSVVKRDVVISAANCFWDEARGALSTASFAVAAGKLLAPWDARDPFAQKSDIASIHVPALFGGARAHYAHDIAAVRLRTPLRYTPAVQPLCVSFDPQLDKEDQWRDINGELDSWPQRFTGWGINIAYKASETKLYSVVMITKERESCPDEFSPNYSKYFTKDKICGGSFLTAIAFCQKESGGGLIHYSYLGNSSTNVPYLYAVGSTMRGVEEVCNHRPPMFLPATFTHVLYHKEFLKEHVPEIEDECSVYLGKQSTEEQSDETGRNEPSGKINQSGRKDPEAEAKLTTTEQSVVSSLSSDPTQASPATPLPAEPNVQTVAPAPSLNTPEGVSIAVSNGTVKITVTSAHTITIELPQKIFNTITKEICKM